MSSNIVRVDAVRSLAFGAISPTYAPIGTAFGHAMRVLHFINNTDADMMISFDNSTDNIPVLANSFALYDLTSDQDALESFRYEKGSQLYIKSISALTMGTFYVVAVYGKGE